MSNLYHDYEITDEALLAESEKAGWLQLIFFSIIVISINIVASYYIYANIADFDNSGVRLTFSVSFSIVVFLMGLIGGKYWQTMGMVGAKATYAPFVEKDVKKSQLSKLYIKFFESDSAIYFEGRAKDRRLKGPLSVIPLVFRISLSQMGFYITATAFIIGPTISTIRSYSPFYKDNADFLTPLLTLGVSTFVLGFYIPLTMIIEDSNLRSFDEDTRFVNVPGSTFRNRFDAIVGIGALTSGWSIFSELRIDYGDGNFFIPGDTTFYMTLDYICWLGFILILSWPLIAPASMYYFMTLDKSINKFRSEAIIAGVPLGVTKIRPPEETEIVNIAKFIRTIESPSNNSIEESNKFHE